MIEAAFLLVVDDQEMNRDMLSRRLRKRGYTVAVAEGGAEALERIRSQAFDLVLLDIMMPGITGMDVLREVRKQFSAVELPIIMATGREESQVVVEALHCGANDYVTKPLDLPVVLARIETHLSLKRTTSENRRLFDALQTANQELERLATVDGLTGVANRRSFDQFLDKTWRSAVRHGKHVALIMADVDEFKAYNDAYGHQAGDDCLKLVASRIAEMPGRAGDLVARYGGEEFAIVLDRTDAKGALVVAERVRAGVEQLAIAHPGSGASPYVTLSLGVASAAVSQDSTPEALVAAADQALYRAKREGRNRVVQAAALVPYCIDAVGSG